MIFGTGLGTPFIAQRKLGIPGKLFGLVRGAGRLAGGLTNSLKGTVSAGAVLAGALHLNMALAGTVPGGGVLGGALTAASPVALDLPFSTMSSGADLTAKGVTYTSSGLGTQYDSTGRLTWKPNNLFVQSNDLTNVSWSASLPVSGGFSGPTSQAAFNIVATAGENRSRISQSLPASRSYIIQAKCKANGCNYVALGVTNEGGVFGDYVFDLSNGTVSAFDEASGLVTGQGAQIVSLGNGWYLCSVKAYTDNANDWFIGPSAISTGYIFGGPYGSTGGVLVCDMQLEAVTYQTSPRPYVATTSAAYYGPRFDYDPVTLQPKGLLIEESRTNLFYPSDLSGMAKGSGLTLTTGVSDPAGTNTAITLTATTSSTWNGTNYYYKALVSALTGGSTYASSVWMRRRSGTGIVSFSGCNVVENDVTLTATWQRIVVVQTALSTTLNFQIDVLTSGDAIDIAFGQVELGSFATSLILTTSASVTRAAETASMTGTNFSSWYNQSEGTIVTEFISGPSDARPAMLVGSMVAETPFIMQQFAYGSGQIGFSVFDGAGYQASLLASGASGISHKFAGAYKANDFAAALDGGSVLTDTAGTVPTIVALRIGSYSTAGDKQIWIKSLTYYNTRKSDAELQSLTT